LNFRPKPDSRAIDTGASDHAPDNPLKNLPSTDYRFPFEREEDTAFVDPYMEVASIFHRDTILQARFHVQGTGAHLVYR